MFKHNSVGFQSTIWKLRKIAINNDLSFASKCIRMCGKEIAIFYMKNYY